MGELPLERLQDIVDRALKAEQGLDGSDSRLHTYANARAKVEGEFWGWHKDLLDEIARLRDALAWYGDEGNYSCKSKPTNNPDFQEIVLAVQKDRGQRARAALKEGNGDE